LDLGDAGESERERRPRLHDGFLHRAFRASAAQVRWNRDVDLLRMREAEVTHVADEIILRDRLGEAWIEALFFVDARHGEAAVIVRGIEQTVGREREDLRAHGAEERAR